MSSTTTTTAIPQPSKPTVQKSFVQLTVSQTFADPGAKIGLAWLVFLAFLAVFAPLLANSNPLLLKSATGQWSSPMWRALTPVDLSLLLGATAATVTLLLRRKFWPTVIVGLIAATLGLTIGAIKGTPASIIYSSYREAEKAGTISSVYRAPVTHSPNDRNRDDPNARRQPPTWAVPTPAASASSAPALDASTSWFLLGSDREGSDVAARLIYACRTALAIGVIATGISTLLGIFFGGIMGYFAGWIDILGMRAIEICEAVPRLMLLLAVAAIFGADIFLLMLLIGLTGWMGTARFIRAEFLRLRKQDFVQAAQALGLPLPSIIFRHMLPNGLTPILVTVPFGVAGAILIESTLAFLGIGKADQPSWGQLLNQAREGGEFQWWIAIFPGLMIFLTVLAYQLLGEALRDALDPTLKKRD